MTGKKLHTIKLTEDELVAIFIECNCCAAREPWTSANEKVYAKLKQIGHWPENKEKS